MPEHRGQQAGAFLSTTLRWLPFWAIIGIVVIIVQPKLSNNVALFTFGPLIGAAIVAAISLFKSQ